jgi:cyclase
MPLCYGGGVTNVEQAIKIINLGAEKVAISTAAINNPALIREIGNAVGIQSVIVVLDIKKRRSFLGNAQYEIFINNGKDKTDLSLEQFLKKLEEIGIGELVINSIDLDGTMKGYDIELVQKIRDITEVPITVLGGAGNLSDLKLLINKFKVIGAAAGSLFVFKGKYKAVLINYPNKVEKKNLCKDTNP